jgi:signal transduction histidine kinase
VIAVGALALLVLNRSGPSDGLAQFVPNSVLSCVALSVLGAVILRRHHHHPIGLLLVGLGLATGLSGLGRAYVGLVADGSAPPAAAWAYGLASFLWVPGYALVTTLLLVIFPDGRPPSPRWWPLVIAIVAFVAVDIAWFALTPFPTDGPPEVAGLGHPLGLTGEARRIEDVFPYWGLLWLVLVLGSLAALVTRLARADPLSRRQLAWFALGSFVWLGFVVLDSILTLSDIGPLLDAVFLTFPPLGAAIGILRYRLLDVDRVIHRGMLAALFAAVAGILYAGTVLLAERLVGRQHDLGTSVVAVGVVAVAALPAWRGLNQAVERLLYGQRSQPFQVVARLGAELDAAVTPEILFQRVAHSLAESLRLPYVAIEIDGLEEVRVGEPQPQTTAIGLAHNGIPVGSLVLGHRSETEPLSREELRLLDDLARRLAATAHGIQLASDLRRSREQLVLAREEERRRIRHDLHDSLGPQLAGIGLQLDLAREAMKNDPVRLEPLLARAKDELSDAILDVRRVVDGLRPPALDELGLVSAIRQQVGLLDTSALGGTRISVDAPDDLGPLPAAVEVAAFRIATEAVTNAVRHSGARACTVELRRCDAFEVEIRDDGHGIQDEFSNGVGLVSLRERAEELGGEVLIDSGPARGTRVWASLPLA